MPVSGVSARRIWMAAGFQTFVHVIGARDAAPTGSTGAVEPTDCNLARVRFCTAATILAWVGGAFVKVQPAV